MDTRIKKDSLATSSRQASKPAGRRSFPRGNTEHVIDISSSNEDADFDIYSDGLADEESGDRTGDVRGVSGTVVGAKRARITPRDSPAESKSVKKVTVNELPSVSREQAIIALPAAPYNDVAAPLSPPSFQMSGGVGSCKQFWRAGDYEGGPGGGWELSAGGYDHVRVHPKFLHSNATSHKWALGAFAELLDNALDEVHSGATYVNVDMLQNRKDGNRMVLIEDNGGGMTPEKVRHCMSLGYSAKSKLANTIGQYGNGFKTSTMRLGADVIVFSRCLGKNGKSLTQSIGLLSYTFLRNTGKEDIVVPMLDYERRGSEWCNILRSSVSDWDRNVETIVQWSPFSTEEELLSQFNLMKDHGTRIIIYNLWEDDEGMLELDFETDPHDIQLRGVNRDEKNIKMASQFPNSRHFLTYKHSLRSYASILYLRIPPAFRIILRGRDVEHHSIVNDMMLTDHISYRPQCAVDGSAKLSDMPTVVTIGFVKDAKHHVDVQGFNVYHKNRLIKPYWRIWNAAGSDGRGVIGVLEANFVEPAHDKQGFEHTIVLSRLRSRLLHMQKKYWNNKCHKIGYASRQRKISVSDTECNESSPECDTRRPARSTKKTAASDVKTPTATSDKFYTKPSVNRRGKGSVKDSKGRSSVPSEKGGKLHKTPKSQDRVKPQEELVVEVSNSDYDNDYDFSPENASALPEEIHAAVSPEPRKSQSGSCTLSELEQENEELRKRLNKKEEVSRLLQEELRHEKELRKRLEAEVETKREKLEEMDKEHCCILDIFAEERDRRDVEEENLRQKLEDAMNTIQELVAKAKTSGRS